MPTIVRSRELQPATLERVHELIEVDVDSSAGFRKAATTTDDPHLAGMFHDLAHQRARFAQNLRAIVPPNAVRPLSGTWLARIHRWWIDVRDKLAFDPEDSLLAEIDRGEEHIARAYAQLVEETAGSSVRPLLESQHQEIREVRARIRDLRRAKRLQASR